MNVMSLYNSLIESYNCLLFFICKFPWHLGNYKVVSSCLFYSLEFRVILLIDWLPFKPREPNLPCYLTHSWWGEVMDSCLSQMQQTRLILNTTIQLSALINIRSTMQSRYLTNYDYQKVKYLTHYTKIVLWLSQDYGLQDYIKQFHWILSISINYQ